MEATIINIDNQNREQQQAFELAANTNSSFFLTGRAGTGKTTILRYVDENVKNKNFVVLAPTGIAAINAGGETIHSFFGLPLTVCEPGTCGKMNQERILTLVHADAIIIDEVSMVRCDIMDAIDYTMRKVLRRNVPFGGKQMIFVGDMFQLPPVVKYDSDEERMLRDIYGSNCSYFFYNSHVIRNMTLPKIELQKVYRQDDEGFLQILEDVRLNKVTTADLERLNERLCTPTKEDGAVITLTTSNRVADKINAKHLEEIDAKEFLYEGELNGMFEAKRLPAEQKLRLKVGAQVMFTNNDPMHHWVNGTLGTVEKLSKDSIHVSLDNGCGTYEVKCNMWNSIKYEYDEETKKLKKIVVGKYIQYPLRLAWAITIHKSQGLSFSKMELNLKGGTFVNGQLYVALSRVRSLDGLFLTKAIIPQFAGTSQEVLNFAAGYNNDTLISNEIESGKAVYDALRSDDYDEMAKQYLLIVQKKFKEGDIREAIRQTKHFLDTVICDEHLYGCIESVPMSPEDATHKAQKFLVALLSLYVGKYEQALECADAVLALQDCQGAMYVKARSLTKLERYAEADAVYDQLSDKLDLSMPDVKILYAMAMLNELHTSESGLGCMSRVVDARRKYDHGILAFRKLIKRKELQIAEPSSRNELVKAFDSDISEDEFAAQLKLCRKKNHQAVSGLVNRIDEYGKNEAQ